MPTKKRNSAAKKGAAANSIDVTKTADIPKLGDLLKKNKLTVVLIWANYCGHCHTFKDDIWSKLLSNKNRKAGLASIHYDQLENAPEPIPKKVSGYPSVFLVKNNGAVEYPNSRDLGKMNSIVESAEEDPESQVDNELENDDTPPLTSDSENQRNNSPEANPQVVINSISRNLNGRAKSRASVPNPMDDMLNSQNKNGPLSIENRMDSGVAVAKGGSLYNALVDMFRKKQTRSTKSKKSRQTRRSHR
jgi:thiol-disulfide isomerase/thioredoxin